MKFTWIPFYKEFAQKLLQFKDNRVSLVNWIYDNLEGYINHLKDGSDGRRVPDIDPFSVFAIINRGITIDKKQDICSKFKNFLNISTDIPQDFRGVPEMNNQKSNFIAFEHNRKEGDIERLWAVFEDAVLDKDIEASYNALSKQFLISKNLTLGLFWIRPDKYLALDSKNVNLFKSLLNVKFHSGFVSYNEYDGAMKLLNEKMQSGEIKCSNYAEFSQMAFEKNNGASNMLNDSSATAQNSSVAYWTYSPGEHASKWNDCIQEGIMCIGWDSLGNLTQYATRDDMQHEIKQYYPTEGSAKNDSLAVWQFTNEMKPGDIVYAKKGRTTIIGRGVVESDYYFDDNRQEYKSVRKVSWTNVGEWNTDDVHAMKTLTNIIRDKDFVEKLESLFGNAINNIAIPINKYQEYIDLLDEAHNLVLTGAPGTGKTYMAKAIAKEMSAEFDFVQFHPSYDYTDFVEGLRPLQKENSEVGFERKDGIFKEFCKKALKNWEDSQKTADEIIEEKSLEDNYNELLQRIEDGELNEFQLRTEDKVMEVVEISDNNNIILKTPGTDSDREYIVSFNRLSKLAKAFPSLLDLNKISNIAKEIRDVIGGCNASAYWAVLREIYKQGEELNNSRQIYIGRADIDNSSKQINPSEQVKEKKYIFIIDEINRGEISKIFGELFFSIDPGYRGVKGRVKTQYQNLISADDVFYDGFFVPENVYILATMNDIDRSVESMDFAMRRRFTWKEITPDDTAEMLDTLDCAEDAIATMNRLNAVIAKTEGLGAAYMIGPSYFLKLDENGGDFSKLWKMNIEPLLKEYLRGFRKSGDILIKLQKAYFDSKEESENNPELIDED